MSKSQLFRYRSKNRLITTTKENARGQVQKHIAYLSNCPIQGYVLERLPSSNSTTLGALAEFLSIIYAYWRVPVYERRQPKNIIPVRNYLALEAPSDCQKQSEKLGRCVTFLAYKKGCVIWWKISIFSFKRVLRRGRFKSYFKKNLFLYAFSIVKSELVCANKMRIR